jgi:hypothetical protein
MDQPTSDPRRSPRSKVFLAATLECADGELPVTLRDLSEHGALIETQTPLTQDAEVWFRRNELRVHGHIAWVQGKFAGVCFSRGLKPEVVLRHINRPAPRTLEDPVHRRPALTRPGMSPEEQRWAEEILSPPLRKSGGK